MVYLTHKTDFDADDRHANLMALDTFLRGLNTEKQDIAERLNRAFRLVKKKIG